VGQRASHFLHHTEMEATREDVLIALALLELTSLHGVKTGRRRQCPFCQSVLVNKRGLQEHLKLNKKCSLYRVNTMDIPISLMQPDDGLKRSPKPPGAHQCPFCLKRFATSTYLNYHLRARHFTCWWCGEITNSNWREDLLMKPHQCSHGKERNEAKTFVFVNCEVHL